MVTPISRAEITTARPSANTVQPLSGTTKAVLKLNYELQRQITRLGGNLNQAAWKALTKTRPHSKNTILALQTVIRNRPEEAASLLEALSPELATEDHGLAKFFHALEKKKPSELPTPAQLTDDLGNICSTDSMTDKTLVTDLLDKLSSGFIEPARITIERGGSVPAHQLRRFANLNTVLIKALGKLSDNTVTTIGNLRIDQLDRLINAYDLALQTNQPHEELDSIEATRNILDRKRQAIVTIQEFPLELENMDEVNRDDRDVVFRAVQMMGWALSFASERLKNDREIVLAAVSQNGWVLGFASEAMREDKQVVMTAVRNNGIAFQYASKALKKDKELAVAALRNSQISMLYMSREFQRDPELRAIAFPRLEEN